MRTILQAVRKLEAVSPSHVPTYWLEAADSALQGVRRLSGNLTTEVAIIGGGYTGLSAAYHLAKNHGVHARSLRPAGSVGERVAATVASFHSLWGRSLFRNGSKNGDFRQRAVAFN